MSVGDALRELDSRQLITNDFILTFGDLVSNMKLDKVLETHRARKKTDKNSIMTMVLKEATRTHSSRAKDESSVFVLDPNNSQCLFYEPVEEFPRKGRIEISPEIFENHTQFEFRNDLVDPFLDICSVEVSGGGDVLQWNGSLTDVYAKRCPPFSPKTLIGSICEEILCMVY